MIFEPLQHFKPGEGLTQEQTAKVRKLVENGNIVKVGPGLYNCLPTPGYNKTTYELIQDVTGRWTCNCQGFGKRGTCSHVEALKIVLGKPEKKDQEEFKWDER